MMILALPVGQVRCGLRGCSGLGNLRNHPLSFCAERLLLLVSSLSRA